MNMFEYVHVCYMGGPPCPPSHIIQAPTSTHNSGHPALTIQGLPWPPDMFKLVQLDITIEGRDPHPHRDQLESGRLVFD